MRHVDSILTYIVRDRYDLPQMINGLLQRLTQKEKEVTQLRGEIDRLKIQNSGEAYDPVSRPISMPYWIGKMITMSESRMTGPGGNVTRQN